MNVINAIIAEFLRESTVGNLQLILVALAVGYLLGEVLYRLLARSTMVERRPAQFRPLAPAYAAAKARSTNR
jgi:hypothetical protein